MRVCLSYDLLRFLPCSFDLFFLVVFNVSVWRFDFQKVKLRWSATHRNSTSTCLHVLNLNLDLAMLFYFQPRPAYTFAKIEPRSTSTCLLFLELANAFQIGTCERLSNSKAVSTFEADILTNLTKSFQCPPNIIFAK